MKEQNLSHFYASRSLCEAQSSVEFPYHLFEEFQEDGCD